MLLFTASTQHQSLRKTPWTCWRDICQNWASRRTPKTVRRRPSAELIWFESYCPLVNNTTTDKQDVDIWEEPEEGNVIRDGDNITGGTLNKLVEKLTAEKTPGLSRSSPALYNVLTLLVQQIQLLRRRS
jgi:hypothetical protein